METVITFILQDIAQTHNKYEVVPIVLLGNKCDLQTERKVKTKEGKKVLLLDIIKIVLL